jgi:hypothetical protein
MKFPTDVSIQFLQKCYFQIFFSVFLDLLSLFLSRLTLKIASDHDS